MKMPYMKFYTRDWRSDDNLQVCPLEARGAWIEMICIMAQSENCGYLEKNGEPYSEDALAMLIRTDKDTLNRCIENLENNGVLSRDARGVIYCRRMVQDKQRHDAAVESGSKGGNPTLVVKSRIQNPESRTQNPEPTDSLRGGVKGRVKGSKETLTWKNSFEVYLESCKEALTSLQNDEDFIKKQERFNPNVDIRLSLEKAFENFWGTEAGWKRKKSKRSKTINWKSTFTTAIDINKVWKPREAQKAQQSTASTMFQKRKMVEDLEKEKEALTGRRWDEDAKRNHPEKWERLKKIKVMVKELRRELESEVMNG